MSILTKESFIVFLSAFLLSSAAPFALKPACADEIDDCLSCHADPDIEDESGRSLNIKKLPFLNSVHGSVLTCTDCHQDIESSGGELHEKETTPASCTACHDEETQEYETSVHAKTKFADEREGSCTACHGKHYILSPKDPGSPLFRTNQMKICTRCHENNALMSGRGRTDAANFVKSYEKSIHGLGVSKAGLKVSAVCSDCHQAHAVVSVKDKSSPAWRRNIPKTCSKCHIGVYRVYKKSIHGKAFFKGNPDSPVCTDCHGEHTIRRPQDESASVYTANIPRTCSRCHDDMALDDKYGLPSKRLASYMGSYHGIALSLGDVRVANCASCHGYHNILPSSDPESSVNPANLQATCGSCHPQAGRNFARAKIHLTDLKRQNIGVLIVKRFYTALIAVLVLSFIGLIALDLSGHARRRRGAGK
jgi:predicted CXXCH cytochrome family protein